MNIITVKTSKPMKANASNKVAILLYLSSFLRISVANGKNTNGNASKEYMLPNQVNIVPNQTNPFNIISTSTTVLIF